MILGHREDYHKTAWLSEQQKELLIDIYRKTEFNNIYNA